jgi:hypothetical protein
MPHFDYGEFPIGNPITVELSINQFAALRRMDNIWAGTDVDSLADDPP